MMRFTNQLATFVIGFGVGFVVLRALDPGVGSGIAWLLLLVGAIGKLVFSSKSHAVRQKVSPDGNDVS